MYGHFNGAVDQISWGILDCVVSYVKDVRPLK